MAKEKNITDMDFEEFKRWCEITPKLRDTTIDNNYSSNNNNSASTSLKDMKKYY